MFRGFPHISSYSHPCRYCKGTAQIKSEVYGDHVCTSCNGTGIDGEPADGCLMILGMAVLVIAIIAGVMIYG